MGPRHGAVRTSWTARDWKIELTEGHVAELFAALSAVDRPEVGLRDITKENFPLPTLAPVLEGVVDELVDGRGFALVRGVPVEQLRRQAELMYWGIGLYVGIPIHQKTEDDLLVHVEDQGVDRDDPLVRGYQTNARLDYPPTPPTSWRCCASDRPSPVG